jgi:indolepyruvate ferredoxin oxidoreductase, beta subunit
VVQLILCGRGGQGIVFLTRLLGEIATQKGLDVISSETHGMAVRGGSVNSHLKIGPFRSPLVRTGQADYLLSMDESETSNNEHFLGNGGLVFENSLLPSKHDVFRVDAAGLARSIGRIQLENVVLLGFAASLADLGVPFDDIENKLATEKRETVRRNNLMALKAGSKVATELKALIN